MTLESWRVLCWYGVAVCGAGGLAFGLAVNLIGHKIASQKPAQRAWVGVTGIALDSPFGHADKTNIAVRIKNTGQLPATVKIGINVTHGYTYPLKENHGIIGDEHSLSNGALLSGSEVVFTLTWDNAIFRNYMPPFIYVHGYLWYTDDAGKHTTSFCFYWDSKHPEHHLQMCSTNNSFK